MTEAIKSIIKEKESRQTPLPPSSKLAGKVNLEFCCYNISPVLEGAGFCSGCF